MRTLWRLTQLAVIVGTFPWLWWLWLPALLIDYVAQGRKKGASA